MGSHAEGSSSGTGHSDDRRCTIQVNAYVKDDAKLQAGSKHSGCTPVMLSITGSSGLTERRNPIDVVLVLHVHIRYAAPANWHDLVNRATGLLVEKLGDKDRLAVVPALLKEAQIVFGDAVIAPIKPRLLLMSPENKAAAREAVEASEAMRTNSPLTRDLESAESILYGRRSDEKEERADYIIVISNSNEDLSSVLSWRFRSVHAFGFHSANNARAMHAITNRGDSTYAVLDKVEEGNNDNQIAQAFTAIVDKITSAIEPMEIRLKCNEEVLLSEIYAPRICNFISYDKKVGIIWAHARGHSAATNFIILLEIPDDYYEYHNLLEVHAKFGHGHPPNSVDVKGRPLVAVRKGVNGSIQVAAEIVRMQALRIVTEITDEEDHRNDNNQKKLSTKLRDWHSNLLELNFGTEAAQAEEVQKLAREMEEMQERLQTNNLWLEYMLSWQSYQWWPLRPLIINGKYATIVDSGVNNNMATTDHNSLVQTRILAKVDAIPVPMQKPQRGIPVLVHIKVPSDLEGKQRVPIDLVAVLDVRKEGSDDMNEQKLKLLNKVMGFLMEKLSDKDRLSIVSVHSADTESAAAFQHMTIQGRSECMKVLSALTSVIKAAQQASQRRDQPSTSKKALCLPMATVNSPRVYGSSTLSKSLKDAVKRLDDRDDKTAMGLIMIISDTDDEHISVSHRTLSPYYAIHAFSLCSVDNARALYPIASRSMGIYGILLSDDQSSSNEIAEAFRAFISNITSTIAVNTEVNIVVDDSSGATLSTIESGHFKSRINHDKKSGVIYAGALYPGAERRFVVYVDKVREDEYGRMTKMLAVTATCWQHEHKKDKSDGVSVYAASISQGVAREMQWTYRPSNFFPQKMVIVRGKDPGSKELVEEIIRIEEVKMLSAIADPKTKIDVVLRKMQELRKRLIEAQQQASADVVGVRTRRSDYAMAVDEESLASLTSDKDGFRLPYMLSWLSFLGLCEQTPPVPTPTTPRRETDQNSLQPHGRP